MTEFIQNAYVFLWGALALLTFAVGVKQKTVHYFVISLFFIFMTVWYGLRSFGGYEMFGGSLGIIFKCVAGAFLLLFIGIYLLEKKRKK